MAKNPRDQCPIKKCAKSITKHPRHFGGVPADSPQMLRCVLYEMFMLASDAAALRSAWPRDMIHTHPTLGEFSPSEGLKRSALVSFRLLYDFFYNPSSGDDFSVNDFARHGAVAPKKRRFKGLEKGKMFTKESVNKWIAHLTWARINKPRCVPQAKFQYGDEAIVENCRRLLIDAKKFVGAVTGKKSPSPVILDADGEGYLKMFTEAEGILRVKLRAGR
jgi:hypothetical protein